VASSITIVTAGEIEARQLRTLPDVLRDLPGLNVVRSGGPGGQTSVFMRWYQLDHTKVFVDGIDVNDPSSPNASFDFRLFLAQDIAKVEGAARPAKPGFNGSDAIGGVINILTKGGSGPATLVARVEGGSLRHFQSIGGPCRFRPMVFITRRISNTFIPGRLR